jgi:hypothetical protein
LGIIVEGSGFIVYDLWCMRSTCRRGLGFGGWGSGRHRDAFAEARDLERGRRAHLTRCKSVGFRVQGSEFGVPSSGFRVQGAGFRVGSQGLGLQIKDPGRRAHLMRSSIQGSESRVQGLGFRVQGPGFRVLGQGSRVQGPGLRI